MALSSFRGIATTLSTRRWIRTARAARLSTRYQPAGTAINSYGCELVRSEHSVIVRLELHRIPAKTVTAKRVRVCWETPGTAVQAGDNRRRANEREKRWLRIGQARASRRWRRQAPRRA